MNVLINNEEVALDIDERPAFGDVIEQAEKFSSEQGKIITEITLNGEVVTPDEEAAKKFDPCDGSTVIEMLMDTPQSIIIKALGEADKDLPAIAENLRQVASYLQTGSRQAAFSLFSESIEQWKQVINLFRIVESALQIDAKSIVIGGRSLDCVQGELLELLLETRNSMQDDDAVTLSDLLEYELAPNIEQQRDVIRELIELVEKGE